jgi:sigma-B regulation protein RsbU (phosphoserine phosphatase)
MKDIDRVTKDSRLELASQDVMVLYSDGITEARNRAGEQFGMDRLCRAIEAHRGDGVEAIRDAILDDVQKWQAAHDDDLSLVVVRRS